MVQYINHPSGRHCRRAIRYGREILMPDDHLIEKWPTANRAKDRLDELSADGYTVSGTDHGHITYAEWLACGPAHICGAETRAINHSPFEPPEVVVESAREEEYE